MPADVDLTIEQRIIEASARLPSRGMITGWAALRLVGAAYFEGRQRAVPLLLPHACRIRAPGVEVRRSRLPLPTPELRYGVPCAPTAVALVHEMRLERDLRELVVMIEMALLARVVTRDEVRAVLESTRQIHARHFDAFDLATGECRSPPEVRMMLTWLFDARFATPMMNREVERAAALREVGLESFTIVAGDSIDVQVQRMRAARQRALWLPSASRRWRVGQHVPMRSLMRPLTWEESGLLRLEEGPPDDGWGTETG